METQGRLTDRECFARLAAGEFGRLALLFNDEPLIFPVNYAFDAGRVIIRTSLGTKLDAAPMTTVAFQIDGNDGDVIWSVVARGPAFDVSLAHDEYSEEARLIPVSGWAPVARDRVLRITVHEVAGCLFPTRSLREHHGSTLSDNSPNKGEGR